MGINLAKSLRKVSGSLVAGWLRGDEGEGGCRPKLKDFLSGHGLNFGYGYWFGRALQYSLSTDSGADEVGIVTPQFGVTYMHYWELGNIGKKW